MKDLIRDVKDFPKSGVVFKDIFPLLQESFSEVIDELAKRINNPKGIDYIVGIESRGFIFAAALAYKLNVGFIPIRKKGKLPPPTRSQKFSMEYAETELEISLISEESLDANKRRVLIVDDVMASGQSIKAAWDLCTVAGYLPQQAMVLINIKNLNKNDLKVKSLFDYTSEDL